MLGGASASGPPRGWAADDERQGDDHPPVAHVAPGACGGSR